MRPFSLLSASRRFLSAPLRCAEDVAACNVTEAFIPPSPLPSRRLADSNPAPPQIGNALPAAPPGKTTKIHWTTSMDQALLQAWWNHKAMTAKHGQFGNLAMAAMGDLQKMPSFSMYDLADIKGTASKIINRVKVLMSGFRNKYLSDGANLSGKSGKMNDLDLLMKEIAKAEDNADEVKNSGKAKAAADAEENKHYSVMFTPTLINGRSALSSEFEDEEDNERDEGYDPPRGAAGGGSIVYADKGYTGMAKMKMNRKKAKGEDEAYQTLEDYGDEGMGDVSGILAGLEKSALQRKTENEAKAAKAAAEHKSERDADQASAAARHSESSAQAALLNSTLGDLVQLLKKDRN